jgi:nucleotide-binding universal stress UspA family protein
VSAATDLPAQEAVVVAYDGSPASRRALLHAASLARRRAVVAVVHVVRTQAVSSSLTAASDAELLAQARLLREAQIVLEDRGVECRTIAATGDPSAEILSAVEELGARWLVVGRGDHRHRLRRSTTMRLARGATCGVVVVR